MGLPNNVDVVAGDARIPIKAISVGEWCQIVERILLRIKPCLKYVAGFQTLAKLLNSAPMTGRGRLVTPDNALPNLEDTGINQKTRFVAVDMWEPAKSSGAKISHEVRRCFLLLTDNGNLAILTTSCFRQEDHYVVCASSLVDSHSVGGMRFVLDMDARIIRDRINDESISPYNVLDRLYLLFCSDITDGEKRLESKRKARDLLKQMCDRIAI